MKKWWFFIVERTLHATLFQMRYVTFALGILNRRLRLSHTQPSPPWLRCMPPRRLKQQRTIYNCKACGHASFVGSMALSSKQMACTFIQNLLVTIAICNKKGCQANVRLRCKNIWERCLLQICSIYSKLTNHVTLYKHSFSNHDIFQWRRSDEVHENICIQSLAFQTF